MSDNPVNDRIQSEIDENSVVLFMKGTPMMPQCGFSAAITQALTMMEVKFKGIDVLADDELRQGIKEFSSWPTIPQLYVKGEFVGGCDVIQQMYTTGQLHEALGAEPVELVTPKITISDTAATVIRNVGVETPGVPVHLSVDADWNHEFSLAPAKGHEVGVIFRECFANGRDALGLEGRDPKGQGPDVEGEDADAHGDPSYHRAALRRLARRR